MLKSIIAIVVSYVAMLVLFMAVFTGLYFLFGVERIFQPDSYEVSPLWMAVTLVGALLGAVVALRGLLRTMTKRRASARMSASTKVVVSR